MDLVGGGVIELLIETTANNETVDLGYCLGGTSENENVTGGTIDWGDGDFTVFTNGDSVTSDKFKHTYNVSGAHVITIRGKIKWGSGNFSKADANDARHIITEIVIPDGGKSPIYDLGENAFRNCYYLRSIPSNLFDNCTEVTSFSHCFTDCHDLQSIPDHLFDNCTEVTNFQSCFSWCTANRYIPLQLFTKCTKVTNFDSCFYTSFSGVIHPVPDLWNTHKLATSHDDCFANCTNAPNWDKIPEDWK